MPELLEPLAAELERPRELPAQVIHHLSGTYGIEREAIGPFLVNELPKLEDYEIDLALSPVFTPTLQDQAVFAALLGRESVPTAEWPGLMKQLVARPTRAPRMLALGTRWFGIKAFRPGQALAIRNVVAGIDKFLPVDVYIPGCPPTPQALIAGMIKLQEKIDKESIKKVRWYNKEKKDGNYVPMPILGPDLIDVRRNAEIKQVAATRATKESA